ncbi:Histidine triad protein [Bombilactobacillus mellis]|uniref:Histidine triad protein n=1 Tax=Bombilactobacillus mellis TaxID=1218508 RepID=A0A0F4KRU1_9LACO|nr:HIT family protein [Bombilactobacillus mellis]MBI0107632.1 HIT family protein [Lactobacillus sp. W8086]MBI0109098.1 HIT family protein [Lactobacillus sp. W8085]MBI0112517.1 HIT family protein [Lactobacillus sp. W8088]MBI0116030.1 HIT family protein [Lactobacillus sp. W8087]MBI0119958.1 HIT family protein [Lactobacillus sp. W8089]MBI0131923.1 HIT family protein [Lactobacillus sp. W8090]
MSNPETDCVFCNIIAGQIPSYTVYEDEVVKAFLDISQVTPGHVLLVPKKHVKDIFEYDAQHAGTVFARVPKVARAIRAANPEIQGMNICINNGKIAYQSVFHSHIHLVPRYSNEDGFQMKWADNTDQYDEQKLTQIAQKIAQQIGE